MKELMLAIKSHLQNDATLDFIQDGSIYVTPDENMIPESILLPAIAIKDGNIKNEQKLCKNYNQYAIIRITVYQQILKVEESIIGTDGVLDIVADIITSLIDQKLGLTDIMNVFPIGEEASQTIGDENLMIQRKTIIFQYFRHKTW